MTVSEEAPAVEYHSKIAREFHNSYRTNANRVERMRVWGRFIDRYGRNAALAYDLGCGSGILACEVAKRGIETIGIDGSASMLELAALTAKEQQILNITFKRHLLPLENPEMFRQADLVISSSVVEYLPSIEQALRNFSKLLLPGGVMIFSVANGVSVSRRLEQIAYRLSDCPRYFAVIRHFSTIDEINRDVNSVGLNLVEYEFCEQSEGVNRILQYFVPSKYASNMIIVVARNGSMPDAVAALGMRP